MKPVITAAIARPSLLWPRYRENDAATSANLDNPLSKRKLKSHRESSRETTIRIALNRTLLFVAAHAPGFRNPVELQGSVPPLPIDGAKITHLTACIASAGKVFFVVGSAAAAAFAAVPAYILSTR